MTSLFARMRYRQNERGIAAVEFALAAPILILLFLGMAEITNMLVVSEKVDRISYTVTDLVTQSTSLTKTDLNTILSATDQLMSPYSFASNGVVIISSLYKPTGGTTTIKWQYTGGGSLARASQIGLAGQAPSLPSGLTLNDNDNVIVSEVYYAFTPLFINAGVLAASDLYRASFYKPRLTALITPPT